MCSEIRGTGVRECGYPEQGQKSADARSALRMLRHTCPQDTPSPYVAQGVNRAGSMPVRSGDSRPGMPVTFRVVGASCRASQPLR